MNENICKNCEFLFVQIVEDNVVYICKKDNMQVFTPNLEFCNDFQLQKE
jgi:hypothetical protein